MASNAKLLEALTDIEIGNPVDENILKELYRKGYVDKDGNITLRGMAWAEKQAERQLYGEVKKTEMQGKRVNDPRVTGFKNETTTPGLAERAPGGAKNPITVENVSKGQGPETVGQNPYWATTRINPETGEPYTLPRVERRVAASNARRLALQREAAKYGARITGLTGRDTVIPGFTERDDQPEIGDLRRGTMDPERARRIGEQLDRAAWRELREIDDRMWREIQSPPPRTLTGPPPPKAPSPEGFHWNPYTDPNFNPYKGPAPRGTPPLGPPDSPVTNPTPFSRRIAEQLHHAIDLGAPPERVSRSLQSAIQRGLMDPADSIAVGERIAAVSGGVGGISDAPFPNTRPSDVPASTPSAAPLSSPPPPPPPPPPPSPPSPPPATSTPDLLDMPPRQRGMFDRIWDPTAVPRNVYGLNLSTAPGVAESFIDDVTRITGRPPAIRYGQQLRLFEPPPPTPPRGVAPTVNPAVAPTNATQLSLFQPTTLSTAPAPPAPPAPPIPATAPAVVAAPLSSALPTTPPPYRGPAAPPWNPPPFRVTPPPYRGPAAPPWNPPPFRGAVPAASTNTAAPGWTFATELARQGKVPPPSAPTSAGSTPMSAGSTPMSAGSTPMSAGSTPAAASSTSPMGRFVSRAPSTLFKGGVRGVGPMFLKGVVASLPGMAVNYAGGRIASGAEDVEGSVDRADVGQFLQGLGTAGTLAVPLGLALGATPLGWAGLGLAAAGWGIWNAIRGRGDSFEEKVDKAFSAAIDAGLPPEEEAAWRAEIEMNKAMGMSEDEILAGLQQSLPQAVAEFRDQSRHTLPPEQLLAFQKAWADVANQISQQEMAYINSVYETYLQEAANMGYTPSPSTRMALELGKMAAARDAAARQWQASTFPFDEYVAYQNQLRDSILSGLQRNRQDTLLGQMGLGGGGSLPALSLDQLSTLAG